MPHLRGREDECALVDERLQGRHVVGRPLRVPVLPLVTGGREGGGREQSRPPYRRRARRSFRVRFEPWIRPARHSAFGLV